MNFSNNIVLLTNPNTGIIIGGQPATGQNQGGSESGTNITETNTETGTPQEFAEPAGGFFGLSTTTWIIIIVAYFAVFYLISIRPKRKQARMAQELQSGIDIGEDVITSTGFFGKIVDITDDAFIVEFGTNKGVRIPVKKSEVNRVKAQIQDSKEKPAKEEKTAKEK